MKDDEVAAKLANAIIEVIQHEVDLNDITEIVPHPEAGIIFIHSGEDSLLIKVDAYVEEKISK